MRPTLRRAGRPGFHAREHLQYRAVDADCVSRQQAQQHKPHVAHAGVADDEFEVVLDQSDRRAVEIADDREEREDRTPGIDAKK